MSQMIEFSHLIDMTRYKVVSVCLKNEDVVL